MPTEPLISETVIGGTAPSLPAEVRVHFVLPVDAPQGLHEADKTDEALGSLEF